MISNIFNLTSQLIGTTTEATARGSSFQNNTASIGNTGGGHFSHFSTIKANPFKRFRIFGNNNNLPLENNNNNNLPLSGFEKGLKEGFNPPPGENVKGLVPNVAALVNALTEANLGINHIERELNHIKPTEFRGTETEDPNE